MRSCLNNNEMKDLIENVHGIKLSSHKLMNGVYTDLKNGAEKFDKILRDDVCTMSETNPTIAAPIFTFQVKLRQSVIGGTIRTDLTQVCIFDTNSIT